MSVKIWSSSYNLRMKIYQSLKTRTPNLDELGFFKVNEIKYPNEDMPKFLKNISINLSKSCSGVIVACDFEQNNFLINDTSSRLTNDYPEIYRAVRKRQAEFVAGRFCAKLAMQYLCPANSNSFNLPIGEYREPVWPEHFGGSISHNNTSAISIVNLLEDNINYGIDIENIMTLEISDNIRDQIFNHSEHDFLIRNGIASNLATTIIYSAKEAIFKCLFPIVKKYFAFEDARLVSFDGKRLTFKISNNVHLFNNLVVRYVDCQFTVDDSTVITLCRVSTSP